MCKKGVQKYEIIFIQAVAPRTETNHSIFPTEIFATGWSCCWMVNFQPSTTEGAPRRKFIGSQTTKYAVWHMVLTVELATRFTHVSWQPAYPGIPHVLIKDNVFRRLIFIAFAGRHCGGHLSLSAYKYHYPTPALPDFYTGAPGRDMSSQEMSFCSEQPHLVIYNTLVFMQKINDFHR